MAKRVKALFVILAISFSNSLLANCSFDGISLYGRVEVVDKFEDIRVKLVSNSSDFPDLRVQRVTTFPTSCGRWEFVNNFPDFKIKFVNEFEDLRIIYVNQFPGH